MDFLRTRDIREVRDRLGKTQAELAAMLGTSVRAVSSYEEGWRNASAPVHKLAALFCYLDWRREHGSLGPCWELRGCSPETRDQCVVYELDAGDLCWLFDGHDGPPVTNCPRRPSGTSCGECPMVTPWLPRAADAGVPAPECPRPEPPPS